MADILGLKKLTPILLLPIAVLGSLVRHSHAQETNPIGDPSPVFMSPRCVLVASYVVSNTKGDAQPFLPLPTTEEIVRHIAESFASGGYDVKTTARDDECGDIPSAGEDDRVLRVLLRFDFGRAQWSNGKIVAVGSATAVFERFDLVVVAPVPHAFFGGDVDDPELGKRARQAILDYADQSIVANVLGASR